MSARVLRPLTAALIACVLSLLSINAFAQDEHIDSITETQAIDPITSAEQALVLGDGAVQAVPGASTFGILRMVLTLALVAAAIYGLVFLFKRLSRGSMVKDPFVKILASTALGASRSVHVISVGAQAWLVGSAENGVSLISEIADKDIVDAMLLEDSKKNAAAPEGGAMPGGLFPNFKAMLRRLGMSVESSAPDPEKIRKRSERIKGL